MDNGVFGRGFANIVTFWTKWKVHLNILSTQAEIFATHYKELLMAKNTLSQGFQKGEEFC